MIAEWPSSVSSSKHGGVSAEQRSPSQDPALKKEKKNFRDMFTKVKVFDFGETKRDRLPTAVDGGEVMLNVEVETRNSGVQPYGELKGSYVSDQIQDRYLQNCKDSGVSNYGD